MSGHDLSDVQLNGYVVEPGSWYSLARPDLNTPLRVVAGPHSESHAQALMARAPEAARVGTVFDVSGADILSSLAEALPGFPLSSSAGSRQALPALEAERAGTPHARSAELPLDLSSGDRNSGVPTSTSRGPGLEARAGSAQGVRRCTERGTSTLAPPTSLPATDGVERGGCGDVASPFTPSPFLDLGILMLGVALFFLVWAATMQLGEVVQ